MGDAFRTRTFIESHLIEEGFQSRVSRHLTIDVGALKPNHYALELEVTDIESGATATRRLDFERTAGPR
jgi:hypothetical protein